MLASLNNALGQAIDAKTPQDLFLETNVDTQLGLNDMIVNVTTPSAPITITLPSVAEAAGRAYAITIVDASTGTGANTVTVADQNDSVGWTDQVANGTNNSLYVYSDGRKWWIFESTLA